MNRSLSGTALIMVVLISGCRGSEATTGDPTVSDQSTVIQIDGATAAFPITDVLVREFRRAHSDVNANVGLSGTGVGFQKFCSGDNDILEASRPIKSSEQEACERKDIHYVELPIAYDAVAVVVNPTNTWVESMTIAELRLLWDVTSQGKVMRWKDIRPSWPEDDIHLFGPSLDSGAYDYFTAAVNGAGGVGRGDYTASENEEVLVNGITRDPRAIGYLGFAYYAGNKDALKLVAIDDPAPVLPSTATILDGTYQKLSRPLFLYVNADRTSRAEVSQFVEFYLKNVPRVAAETHCVPLPARAYVLALDRFHSRVTGSMFQNQAARTSFRIDQLVRLQEQPALRP